MKTTALLMSVTLCLALAACGSQAAGQHTPQRYAVADGTAIADMTDMDTVLHYSSNIVLATLDSISDFDGMVEDYQFSVDTDYTDNTPDEIHVYDAYHDAYVVGHSYYLFLEQDESVFYPHPIFTAVSKDLIVDATTQALIGEITRNGSAAALSDIPSEIADALENGSIGKLLPYGNQPGLPSDDPETLYARADVVAKVRLSNEAAANPYISGYAVSCVDFVKGPSDSVAEYIFLSPGLLSNTDYYLFLAEDANLEGAYIPIHNAVLASDVDAADFMG